VDVTFLGQAGLYIETAAGSILCDPWFNPAFFGAWFPFPANDGIDPGRIGEPTYLYVSHLHHDHFDPRFLREHVSKETTVLLPDYPLDKLEVELRELGFQRFIHSKDCEPFELPGGLRAMIMALVAPTDGPIGDSALLLDDGEVRLLNMNDSRPIEPEKLLTFGPVDVHFLQFSGAIWYPMVYEFPEKAIEVLAHKKRVAQLARAYRYIELIDPRVVVPSAGPPCFLDDDLFEFNDLRGDPSNIFPDQPTFIDYVRDHETDRPAGPYDARLMLPGSVMRIDGHQATVSHPLPQPEIDAIFGRKAEYLRAYQARKRPLLEAERRSWDGPRLDLLSELKSWFEPLLAQADLICVGIDDGILLEFDDEAILIDFVGREVRAWDGQTEPRFAFRIERRLVETCVRRHLVDWVNELFLSMRFRARRRGAYNDYVYTWWKCLSEERLQYAEGFYAERGPTQGTWEADGYRIQARCPHMKADLARFATIDDGVLTCALHGWQFELASGRCLTSDGHPLWTQRIVAGQEPDEPAVEATG
jgi:UDP-MurNAc hydroxylase